MKTLNKEWKCWIVHNQCMLANIKVEKHISDPSTKYDPGRCEEFWKLNWISHLSLSRLNGTAMGFFVGKLTFQTSLDELNWCVTSHRLANASKNETIKDCMLFQKSMWTLFTQSLKIVRYLVNLNYNLTPPQQKGKELYY